MMYLNIPYFIPYAKKQSDSLPYKEIRLLVSHIGKSIPFYEKRPIFNGLR